MTLSDVSIRRPVLTWVMMISCIVFGVLGVVRLGVDQFPEMDFPVVTVTARLEGATPEGVEEDVTEVLEEQLNSIAGLRSISSVSSPEAAQIQLEFALGTDLDVAIQDVRDKVAMSRMFLPREVEPPVVGRRGMGEMAILWMPVQTSLGAVEATEAVNRLVKPAMETIPGVSGATVMGRQERNIRIWFDGEALQARGLAANDVLAAIQREHVELPAGSIEGPHIDYNVKTKAEFETVEELENMVITWSADAPVRLKDVARVEDGSSDVKMVSHFLGEKMIGMGIMKQSGANTVAIADEVYDRIDELNAILPHEIQIHGRNQLIDFSIPIREAVAETNFTLVLGAMLAVFVVFIFLRRWRPTLIVALAIPISLITTFGVTWLFGFTLNTMTLLAMCLAVGVVIDDAIVVLENIERHRENGEESFEAAHRGTREIAFAATAATVAIAVVFLPAIFVSGLVGSFLGEFGVTVASAVMVSLFVALTLTPMLAARVPAAGATRHGSVYHYLEVGLGALEQSYRRLLETALAHRAATLAIAAASLFVSFWMFSQLDGEFFPPADQGLLIVRFETPPGSSLEHTEAQAKRVEDWLIEQPEMAGLFVAVGGMGPSGLPKTYQGIMCGILKPREERVRSVQQFTRDARERFSTVPGIKLRIMDMSQMMATSGPEGGAFSVELRGELDLAQLDAVSEEFVRALEATPGFVDVDKSLKLGLPELQVSPDREKAAALGIDARTLGMVVRAMIGGMDVASFKEAGRRHDIRVRLEEKDRLTPDAIGRLYVRSRTGEVVALRNIADIAMAAAPTDITRSDRQRSVSIHSGLAEGKVLSEAIADAQRIAAEVLPPSVRLELSGQAERFEEGMAQFAFAIFLAIIVIYLVLAAQFESFIHPFTVMLALPLAMVGALGALLVTGMTINLFSLIGIIMLFGLVTKNSILLVDYANQLRAEGVPKFEAMRRAAPVRLRPVLMTALSMIFGVLPAALGLGPGAETRQPMAIAVAAGMLSSTVLTLVVVPVFYLALDDLGDTLRAATRRLRGHPEPART